MDILSLIGLSVILYLLMYIIFVIKYDCDLTLAVAEKFGKKLDTLRGQVIWVTGASSGIGEYLALELAKNGAKLVLSARREEELNRVKQKCLEVGQWISDADVLVLPLDMTAINTHNAAFEKVIKTFGKLDVLVNNAGRSQRAMWEEIDLDVDRQMFELNVFGVLSLSRIAVSHFQNQGYGHIAVTSSIAGIMSAPYSGSYTGSKHALHGYFGCLRIEKLKHNIGVTLLCPGPTFSNFLSEAFTDKPGEKFNQPTTPKDNRMTTERCAYLSAVAIANKLDEAWMGLFPIMLICYVQLYLPTLAKWLTSYFGPQKILKLRDSRISMKTS